MKSKNLADKLVQWHQDNPRPHPWQADRDPYKIWLSEIILQQTRVAQGTPYFLKFVENFPTINDLANAEEDFVMSLWQGLGYYSRARNLHATAKYVSHHLGGVFPSTYDDILKLKGIGPYTAAAISSFAYNLPTAVVDGNVIRVISRLYAIDEPIEDKNTKKKIQDIVDLAILKAESAVFNQAIMDFGATQCVAASPNCSICPFIKTCKAYIRNKVTSIPRPKKKIKRSTRYFHYLVINRDDKIAFLKREKNDIWQGLYELPLIESTQNKPISIDLIKTELDIKGKLRVDIHTSEIVRKQKLSHQDIIARFYYVTTQKKTTFAVRDNWIWLRDDEYSSIGKPRVIDLFLQENSITLFR